MIDVSIIIVSWNARKYLIDCLNSLVETSCKYTSEIIVVDNASTDGSAEAVASRFPQVILIENEDNFGFARANNIGIRQSHGRYVCLINSDVVVLPGCVERLIEYMDKNPSVGMTGPQILNPDRTLQVSCRCFPSIWNNLCQALGLNYIFPKSRFFSEPFMTYWAHDTIRKVDAVGGAFWIVSRQALDEVGLLDEDFFIYAEDVDWCKRFNDKDYDVMFFPEAQAIHFGGKSSINAPIRFYLEMQRADLLYWEKHRGIFMAAVYKTIVLLRHILRAIVRMIQYPFCRSQKEVVKFKLQRCTACIQWLFSGRHSSFKQR
ncbi:MAG: glycosyltransferase family 2 protein [Sedimentisphaerales bacterium]|nr:glycosyltransferase family 2 protein [Sedimentisphaerales bacterium]